MTHSSQLSIYNWSWPISTKKCTQFWWTRCTFLKSVVSMSSVVKLFETEVTGSRILPKKTLPDSTMNGFPFIYIRTSKSQAFLISWYYKLSNFLLKYVQITSIFGSTNFVTIEVSVVLVAHNWFKIQRHLKLCGVNVTSKFGWQKSTFCSTQLGVY